MSFQPYRSEQRISYSTYAQAPPASFFGWSISADESPSVHYFTSRQAQDAFVAAVQEVAGIKEAWRADTVAAYLALASWGNYPQARAFGEQQLHAALGPEAVEGDIKHRLDELALGGQTGWGPDLEDAQANRDHLRDVLDAVRLGPLAQTPGQGMADLNLALGALALQR